jgi:hypothetical protein
MNLSEGRMGILTFAVLVIAIVGVWTFAINTFAARHPDNSFFQALTHYW